MFKRFCAMALSALVFAFSLVPAAPAQDFAALLTEQAAVLESALFSDESLTEALKSGERYRAAGGSYAVFLSVSDGEGRAHTSLGSGPSLRSAWNKSVRAAARQCQRDGRAPLWLRVDIVTESALLTHGQLRESIGLAPGSFAFGLSPGQDYTQALLCPQVHQTGLIDYAAQDISQEAWPEELPEEWIRFSCQSYFYTVSEGVVPLAPGRSGIGVRASTPDKGTVQDAVAQAALFLAASVQEDGHFSYGTFAGSGKPVPGYSILRHAGSTWSLVQAYRLTKDSRLAAPIQSSLDALVEQNLTWKDSKTAYVTEHFAGEIKLGGNGIALAALTDYMETFGTQDYLPQSKSLGEGILSMQREDGSFVHVLHADDFSLKDELRTVYYDGEAVYGLLRLYQYTGEAKWLKAAKKAVDYLIENHYEEHGDHWISYAMNELVRLDPSPRYQTFALKNGQTNLSTIYHRRALDPAGMENLMCVFAAHQQVLQKSPGLPYLEEFDSALLQKAIRYRAAYMLGHFFYPETAMFMAHPRQVQGSFFVLEDDFRVRIDDVQHTIGGYCLYLDHYSQVSPQG